MSDTQTLSGWELSPENALRRDHVRKPERRSAHYLERYAMLICVAAYALSEGGAKAYKRSFSSWMHKHWQLVRIMHGLTLD